MHLTLKSLSIKIAKYIHQVVQFLLVLRSGK